MKVERKEISEDDFAKAIKITGGLCNALSKVIRGRSDTIELVITALISDGHVLLEDYPGSGKTTLCKTLGRLIATDSSSEKHILPFRRIQFTPDMLPGDVLGVNVFDPKTGNFNFMHGPVFAHIVLADEINRTGPKVQAAFLECMAEKQVTIDNVTYPLDDLFFVLGTQNPLDLAGTYPLPLVQLDRFLLKLPMSYVSSDVEEEILESHREIVEIGTTCEPVCEREDILFVRSVAQEVYISENLRKAIVEIVQATRTSSLLEFGASTRAALMLQSALRGYAILKGRDYATEDDLKYMLPYVLLHRLRFHRGAGEPHDALMELAAPALEKLASSVKR
ncbi:MAG: magnesium chelatase [Candidatus Dadabacteria bacterium]|nr:MAG: magnesium chelatase [Candidatus Dadabacteria bacterium]